MAFLITILCALIVLSNLWTKSLGNIRFLLGIIYLIALPSIIIYTLAQDWRIDSSFVETRCTLLDKKLEKGDAKGAIPYPVFQVQFKIEDQTFTSWAKINITNHSSAPRVIDNFLINQVYQCWYNPEDPNEIYMEKGWFTGLNNIQAVIISIIMLAVILVP